MLRRAVDSSQMLDTMKATVMDEGSRRVKPSLYFRPTAQTISQRPDAISSSQGRDSKPPAAVITVYLALISAMVVSSMRLENPHSLSYQEQTLTSRPETLVSVESKVEECESWLKSTDTRGAVL